MDPRYLKALISCILAGAIEFVRHSENSPSKEDCTAGSQMGEETETTHGATLVF